MTHDELLAELVYEPETGFFFWRTSTHARKAGARAGSITRKGLLTYRHMYVKKEYWKEHRLAIFYMTGAAPTGDIDHINGDGLDNRIENLREVPHLQNGRNTKRNKTNTSGVPGVSFCKAANKWVAQIGERGHPTRYKRALFECFEDAVARRMEMEIDFGYHPNHGRTTEDRKQFVS